MKTLSIGLPAALIMAVACASPQAARAADDSHAVVPAALDPAPFGSEFPLLDGWEEVARALMLYPGWDTHFRVTVPETSSLSWPPRKTVPLTTNASDRLIANVPLVATLPMIKPDASPSPSVVHGTR